MLRSVILLASLILVAVIVIAPSLPTDDRIASGIAEEPGDLETTDTPIAAPDRPDTVERLFATDDARVVAQPHRPIAPPRDAGLVDLPQPGSPEGEAQRAPEY